MSGSIKRLALTAAVLWQVATQGAQAVPFFSTPTGDELKRVKAREILLTQKTLPGTNVNEFTAVGVINAPWEKVLRYYADPANTRKFQTAIKKLDVLEQEDLRRKARYELGLPWPIGMRHFILDVWAVPTDKYIEWKLIDGDVKEQRGSYAVTPWGDNQTLVSYLVAGDLNTWIPSFIISFLQKGTIPNVILKAREDLESGS